MRAVETLVKCSICGADTEWDEACGSDPVCVDCWDARADKDNELAAYKRAYYQAHKEELAAKQRAYYQAHKEKVRAKQRAYCQAHKEELAAYKRAYRRRTKRRSQPNSVEVNHETARSSSNRNGAGR